MNSRRAVAVVLASISLAAGVVARGVESASQPAASPLDALAWTVGTWRLDGAWSNGSPMRAEATYEVAVGGKFIVVRTRAEPAGGGAMVERDVVLYGVENGQIVQHTFAQDGTVRDVVGLRLDDAATLRFEWSKPGTSGKPPTLLRQELSRDGADGLRWRQFMQIKGEWHTLLDGRFVRTAAAAQPAP